MDVTSKAKHDAPDVKYVREALLSIAKSAWEEHPGRDAHSARVGHVHGYMRGEFGFELMLWLDGTHMNEAIRKLLTRVVPEKRPSEMAPISWSAPQPTQRDDRRPAMVVSGPTVQTPVGGQAQQAKEHPKPIAAAPAAPLTAADRRRKEGAKFAERYANLYLFRTLDDKVFYDCTAGELLKDAERRESSENLAKVTRQERRIALFERNLTLNLTSNTLIGTYYANRDDLVVDALNRAEQIHAS